jgi:glucose-6-phosphate 1-dehydrogenase
MRATVPDQSTAAERDGSGTEGVTAETLLILGASGDLTARLLLPGLGGLLATGSPKRLLLIGSGQDDWDDARWRARVTESFAAADASGPEVDAVIERTRYIQADVTKSDDQQRLLAACEGPPAIYFALPPAVTVKACRVLAETGVPEGTRLVMEKPFGTDAESAQALNALLTRLVPEEQIHRIDHFIGMSTVLNTLGVRFANRMLEPMLHAEHVESVDIVYDETLGLEGRAGYYDGAGALIDMLQSHLLQVLAFVTMEAPATLQSRDVRDCKAQALRATHVWDDDPVASSRRARYTAGEIDGRRLPAYVDEEGIDPSRNTETLAEIVIAVDNARWAGVPFRLRSGKAIGAPRKEITITFRQPRWVPTGLIGCDRPDALRLGLGDHRLALDLNINGEGDPFTLERVTLEGTFGPAALLQYGEVLKGVLEGTPPLSVRGDMAVQSWRIVEPVLKAWRDGTVPLQEYAAGSAGPEGWPA